MKTLHNNIKRIVSLGFFIVFFSTYAQEKIYENELETVYLKDTKEVVYKNTFSSYNQNLIASNRIVFKKEIKNAKKKNSSLLFVSNKNNISVITASYLKIIRKAANRSSNPEEFKVYLDNNLPQLGHQFLKDNNLKELYFISRKDTFNGKIDALPGIL